MFALFAAQAVKHQGQVISAEPIPDVFAALQRNVRSLSDWSAAQGLSVAQITPLAGGYSALLPPGSSGVSPGCLSSAC
ncbi:hypothetical protein WJX72_010211 [[Myrmecia] bisecta]|uniref:Uncharacterized protein n=1 Tax=[Myrmecia] bisecta TaxID=41462 RepID=A0AAW1Q4Q2_9CHLO